MPMPTRLHICLHVCCFYFLLFECVVFFVFFQVVWSVRGLPLFFGWGEEKSRLLFSFTFEIKPPVSGGGYSYNEYTTTAAAPKDAQGRSRCKLLRAWEWTRGETTYCLLGNTPSDERQFERPPVGRLCISHGIPGSESLGSKESSKF